jgi:peptidoglycan/xylan/chitin deacetylase (PgdA/CDA1 family)
MVRFMIFKNLFHCLVFTLLLFSNPSLSAVILQYHHVSEKLPAVTSVSEETFKAHLTYLKNNNFNVIHLDKLLQHTQQGKPLPAKTVAITFDDGYDNNIEQAAPILEEFGYPYTIFVNPQLIDENKSYVMTWDELKALAKRGALIANHSAKHDYLHLKQDGESQSQWLKRVREDILFSEKRIKEEVGHNVKLLAYPYGEFNRPLQSLVKELGFIGIGQHSGAVSQFTDYTRVPRYPASGFYSKLDTLKTKLNSLPFAFAELDYSDSVTTDPTPTIEIEFANKDFYQSQFACFVSGVGRADIVWKNEKRVSVTSPEDIKKGRTRYNCTAPSIKHSGQFYWFSQPWVLQVSE